MRIRATTPLRLSAALAALVALALAAALLLGSSRASGASLSQLNSQLGQQRARQGSLSSSLTKLSRLIGSLGSQIGLVQSREAALRSQLAEDRIKLAETQHLLGLERARIALLRRQLDAARAALSRQLLSSYEQARPDVVSVVLEAHGFTDLLDQLQFLTDAEGQQQKLIGFTRRAKTEANAAATRLGRLQRTDAAITTAAAAGVRALAGMNALLHSRELALARAKSAQQTALADSRARGQALQHDISRVEAQQAAAERAAARVWPPEPGRAATPTAAGPTLGPSGGWAIPYPVVLCESGGQNLSPNSAGASGYYQILPSTWKLFGGTGPAAYQAGKSEQDAVATRIWNGGAGASNWVCAQILGLVH